MNREQFYLDLRHFVFSKFFNGEELVRSVGENWRLLKDTLLSLIKEHVPEKTFWPRFDVPWLDNSVKRELNGGVIQFCPYVLEYKDNKNGTVDFLISGPTQDNDVYFAFGFSNDKFMEDDSILACIRSGGQFYGSLLYIPGKQLPQPVTQAGFQHQLVRADYTDGKMTCHMRRDLKGNNAKIFDLDKTWYVIFAFGPPVGTSNTGKHNVAPKITAERINFQESSIISGHTGALAKRKAHSSLMMIAWVLCTSLGAMIARHYKPFWPETQILSKAIWFQFHRLVMLLAVLLTVIAFVLIFVDVNGYSSIGWSDNEKVVHRAHPILGIIVTALSLINPTMALFRPQPGTKYRPVFNYAHFTVGNLARLAAVVTIFIGFDMSTWLNRQTGIIMVSVFLGYEVVMEVVMEIAHRCYSPSDVEKPAGLEMKAPNEPEGPIANTTGRHPLIYLYILHSIILTGLTIGLVVIAVKDSSQTVATC